jgi:uncharacterized membrane protein
VANREQPAKRATDGATMPSDVPTGLSVFDRFANRVGSFVSRAWFFALCVLLVLVWVPP